MTDKEISKSQLIRLADVFIIGPLIIYAGSRKRISPGIDTSLVLIGIATILYNGRNYLLNQGTKNEKSPKLKQST